MQSTCPILLCIALKVYDDEQIACKGNGANTNQPAAKVADVTAGSTISMKYVFPHCLCKIIANDCLDGRTDQIPLYAAVPRTVFVVVHAFAVACFTQRSDRVLFGGLSR